MATLYLILADTDNDLGGIYFEKVPKKGLPGAIERMSLDEAIMAGGRLEQVARDMEKIMLAERHANAPAEAAGNEGDPLGYEMQRTDPDAWRSEIADNRLPF